MKDSSLHRLGRSALTRFFPTWGARSLPGVPGRVHRNDVMLYDTSEQAIEDYLRAGRSAVENIEAGLLAAGRDVHSVRSCLDFGCGHGRVLRHLAQVLPVGSITACDVDAEGVRFCAAELGARPLVSSWRIDEIHLSKYDLIWSGSVFTHLDAGDGEQVLAKLAAALAPGGVLAFSLHGDFSLAGLEHLYGGLYAADAEAIRGEVAKDGVSFRRYDASFGSFPGTYGMTWHRRDYLAERVRALSEGALEEIAFHPQGWDNHHDVIVFRRGPTDPRQDGQEV